MKGYTVLIIILISIVISTLLYRQKYRNIPDDMDKIAVAMSTIQKLFPGNSSFSFKAEPNDDQVFSRVRYKLAPRYISANKQEQFDTTLVVQYARPLDTSLTAFIQSEQVLWQEKDTTYTYTLTRKR